MMLPVQENANNRHIGPDTIPTPHSTRQSESYPNKAAGDSPGAWESRGGISSALCLWFLTLPRGPQLTA